MAFLTKPRPPRWQRDEDSNQSPGQNGPMRAATSLSPDPLLGAGRSARAVERDNFSTNRFSCNYL